MPQPKTVGLGNSTSRKALRRRSGLTWEHAHQDDVYISKTYDVSSEKDT